MHAKSFLGSERAIDGWLEDLLSENLLADSPAAWSHAVAIRKTLGDMVEQLRVSGPFPMSHNSAAEDEAFFDLLDALAASGDSTAEGVTKLLDGGHRTLDRLRDADRVEVRASTLVVPLDADSSGSNWLALLEYLYESVARLAAKAERLHGRVVVDGADDLLVAVWQSVTERLDVLRDVLNRTIANGRYTGRTASVGDDPTEFVAWTADQFRSQR